jgi:opacity protein-like surface antigen
VTKRRALSAALLGAVLSVPGVAAAQSPPAAKRAFTVGDFDFTPLLQLRMRGEYRHNPVDIGGRDLTMPPTQPDTEWTPDTFALFTRARIGLGAERGALRAQVTLQDARGWGASPPTAILPPGSSLAAFGLYEGWFDVHTTSASTRPSYLRVGRQAVSWADGRILGTADWSPVGRALDVARGHLSLGNWDFEALGGFIDTPRPMGVAFDDASARPTTFGAQLYGLDVAWNVDPLLRLDLFAFGRVVRSQAFPADGSTFNVARNDGDTLTGVLRVSGDGKGWKYGVSGALQGGSVKIPKAVADPALRTTERLAWAAEGHVAKTFDGLVLTPTFRAGVALASGDDGTGQYKAFDPLFPDVHVHHGVMNQFAWTNLVDLTGGVSVAPVEHLELGVDYRYVRLFDAKGEWMNGYLLAVAGPPQNGKEELGHEVDLALRWRPHPSLDLAGGYGFFVLGDGARVAVAQQLRGTLNADGSYSPPDVSHFAYLQATVLVP